MSDPNRTAPHEDDEPVTLGSPRVSPGPAVPHHEHHRLPVDADVPERPVVVTGGLGHFLRTRSDVLAVIAVGGAVGSAARYGLAELLPHGTGAFAWSTFLANVSGCLLIGVLMVLVQDVWAPSRYLRPFLGVGVLGGYTTFSTYVVDARASVVDGAAPTALTYLFATLAAGLVAVSLGIGLGRLVADVVTGDRPSAGHDDGALDVEQEHR